MLNISTNATDDQIKKAYRALAHKYHPDKNPNNLEAEMLFRDVSEAYDSLRDPKKRRDHDRSLQKTINKTSKTSAKKPSEGIGEAIGDLFGDLFSSEGSGKFKPFAKRGTDLKYQLHLGLEDLADGCEKQVTFMRQRSGKEQTAKLNVKIPPGITTGQRMRLKGEGDESLDGGKNGDLAVEITIDRHLLFEKKGADVHLDLPVTFTDAVLGAKIRIPTLRGLVEFDLPKSTPSGKTFRLKGQGFRLSKDSEPGDQFVRVLIDVPDQVGDNFRKLLEESNAYRDQHAQINDYSDKLARILKVRK